MRMGRWQEALVHWETGPPLHVWSCGLGALPDVELEERTATCLFALGRSREALDALRPALDEGIQIGTEACARLWVHVLDGRGELDAFVAEVEPDVLVGRAPGGVQVAHEVAVAWRLAAGEDTIGLIELLLREGPEGVEPRAVEEGKRIAIELALERSLPVADVARALLGTPGDEWLCALLAELGDPLALARADQVVASGATGRELARALFLFAASGTPASYDRLRAHAASVDPRVAVAATHVLRRHPEGWPVERLPQAYY
jgi:hypothetical protein